MTREKIFEMLMSSVKDYAIILLDEEGRIVSWNEGAHIMKGYSESEVIGRNFSMLYPAEDVEIGKPKQVLAFARRYGKFEEEAWRRKKDGTLFFARVVIRTLLNDKNEFVGFSKVTSDITKNRENERIIRANDERFRLLMSALEDYSVILLDPEGTIVNWNEGAHKIIGYTSDEIIGKNFSVFYSAQEIMESKPARELQYAAAMGRFEEEGFRIRKDGSSFFASVIVIPLRDEKNKLRGFAKITRDVSEKREAEQKIREFYSVLSHELKSPMTTIRGTLGLLEGGLVGDLTEAGMEITGDARSSCDRLIRLINDLLDLSKLDSGSFKLYKRFVGASALVSEAVKDLRTLGLNNDLQIESDVAASVPVYVDPARIIQVLTNLISNAIKFSPPKSPIVIDIKEEASDVIFSVTDHGAGIPPSAKGKLFNKFQQLDSSDSRAHEGTGLGLAISKSIVEQHSGKISYLSELGRGSTFWFSIPKVSQDGALGQA